MQFYLYNALAHASPINGSNFKYSLYYRKLILLLTKQGKPFIRFCIEFVYILTQPFFLCKNKKSFHSKQFTFYINSLIIISEI